MANQSNAFGGFGYQLHQGEHRGPVVDFHGVPQIPIDAQKQMNMGGEDWLSADLVEQCDAAIEAAKRDLFARHLWELRNQRGGNQFDRNGRPIVSQANDEDED